MESSYRENLIKMPLTIHYNSHRHCISCMLLISYQDLYFNLRIFINILDVLHFFIIGIIYYDKWLSVMRDVLNNGVWIVKYKAINWL